MPSSPPHLLPLAYMIRVESFQNTAAVDSAITGWPESRRRGDEEDKDAANDYGGRSDLKLSR